MAGISMTPERSMSLNLDSWLNGLGMEQTNIEELLQVNDSFFDAYVQELEGQAPSLQSAPAGPMQQVNLVAAAPISVPAPVSTAAMLGQGVTTFAFAGLPAQPVPMSGIQTAYDAAMHPLSLALAQSQVFVQSQMPPPPQLVAQPSRQHHTSTSGNHLSVLAPSSQTGVTFDLEPTSEPHHEHGSNSGGGDSGGDNYVEIEEIDSNGKKKKRRIRTPKQQVLNKLAQQRYRERRKAKYSEMETTVEALVDQLEKLQTVEKQNVALCKQNEDLAKQLKEQQEQLRFLQQQLQFNTQAAAAQAAAAASNGVGTSTPAEHTVPDLDALRSKLGILIDSMKAVLAQHQLDDKLDGPLVQKLPEDVLGELAAAVAESCTVCMKLLSNNTPLVTQAMSKDTGRFHDVSCPYARAVWNKALTNMNLSNTQEDMLLELRETHLRSLRHLYDERHRLNMKAMALMLPRPSQDPTPEGQVQSRTVYGQMCGLKRDVPLSQALDQLKDNLRQEQKGFMEVNYHLMHKLLTPVQSAKLLVDSYPHSIDALALANCLAVKKGLTPQPPPPSDECAREFQATMMGIKAEMPQTAQPAA